VSGINPTESSVMLTTIVERPRLMQEISASRFPQIIWQETSRTGNRASLFARNTVYIMYTSIMNVSS
jgi:hypothetical protein